MPKWSLVCAAVVLGAGCGTTGEQKLELDLSLTTPVTDGGSDLADGGQQLVSYAQFLAESATAQCQRNVQCGQLDPARLATCVEETLYLNGQVPWNVDTEIYEMRIALNESACLAAIQSGRCDQSDVAKFNQACVAKLFEPLQTPGFGCLSSFECKSGYCAHANGAVQGCPSGICQTNFLKAGDPCPYNTATSQADDSVCNASVAYCSIAKKVCVNYRQLGESCSLDVKDEQICSPGVYFCAGAFKDGQYHGTCQVPTPPAAVGQPCDPVQELQTGTSSCVASSYCAVNQLLVPTDGGVQLSAPSMAVCRAKVASAACDPKTLFQYRGFPEYSTVSLPCVDGQTCVTTDEVSQTGQCQPYGTVGAHCNQSFDCQVGLFCPTDTKVCQPLVVAGGSPPDGGACDNTGVSLFCTSGSCTLNSSTGVCSSIKGYGENCAVATDCASSYCGSNNRCSIQCSP